LFEARWFPRPEDRGQTVRVPVRQAPIDKLHLKSGHVVPMYPSGSRQWILPLTEEAYLILGAEHCPSCLSKMRYKEGDSMVEQGGYTVQWRCLTCEAEWTDDYEVSQSELYSYENRAWPATV